LSWCIAAQGHETDPDCNNYLTSKWLGLIRPLLAGFDRPLTKLWKQDLSSISTPNPNAPKWWRIPGAKQVQVYYKEGHPSDIAGYRCFWIDHETKEVYAKFSAWH
jgi:hypothetical protein